METSNEDFSEEIDEEQLQIDDEMQEDEDEDEEEADDDDNFINDPLSLVSVGLDEGNSDGQDEDEDPKRLLICAVCSAGFANKADLKCHVQSLHDNVCVYTCRHCGGIFSDPGTFRAHVELHGGDETSYLPNSSAKTSKKKEKKSEVEEERKRKLVTLQEDVQKCPHCDMKFANKMSLNIHRIRTHFGNNSYCNVPCPVCKKESSEDLTAHCRREHNIEGVVCPLCAKILSKTCTLNRHIEQVHLNLQIHKPATCDQCGKVFSKKGHLDRHVRTIHMGLKESSQPCPYCGKVFSTKSSLEPHIEMVHKGVRKECPTCGKVLSDLWKHMRTVHGMYRRKAKIPKDSLETAPLRNVIPEEVMPNNIPLNVRKIIGNNVINGSVTIVKNEKSKVTATNNSESVNDIDSKKLVGTTTAAGVKIVKIRGKKSYKLSSDNLKNVKQGP